MAKRTNEETALATRTPAPGFIMPDDAAALQANMFSEGFAEEKTFGIGDPSTAGKVPIYLGELIGEGGSVQVEQMGGKPDPVTGEVPMSNLPVFMFNPVDPTTLRAFTARIDNVIASHQVASACRKYHTIAQAAGGRAQLFIRWNGKVTTRRNHQMNDISVMFRVVKPGITDVEAT